MAAVDALLDAVLRLDEPGTYASVAALLAILDDEAAAEVGAYLTWEYVQEPEDPDGIDLDRWAAAHSLLLGALVRLGSAFPGPEHAAAFIDAAEAVGQEDSEAALDLATLAVQLADSPDDRSQAHVWRALALDGCQRPQEALAEARLADDTADEMYPRLLARAVLLDVMCDRQDQDATTAALDALAWCPDEPEDFHVALLRQAIQRALLLEAARCEDARARVPDAVAAGLRLALSDASWLPDGLTPSWMAVMVAWADFLREDLSRIEETLALAGDGPFGEDVDAQVAMLRVTIPQFRSDVAGMALELRRASVAVWASRNPNFHRAFRLLVAGVTAAFQGTNLAGATAELAGDSPDDDTLHLFARTHARAWPC